MQSITRWSIRWHWQLIVGAWGVVCLTGCPSETKEIRRDGGGTSQVYELRRQLRSTDASERKAAAVKLGQMGEKAEKAITALQQVLLDARPGVRLAAVDALGKIGFKAVPALLYARNRRDPAMKKAASAAIDRLGPERLRALIAALTSPLTSVRIQAAGMLGDMGKSAAEAIPSLSKRIRDEETDVRVAAAKALGQIGPVGSNTANVVMALGTALKKNKMWWNVLVAISETLGSFGPKGAAASAELVPLLSSRDKNVTRAVVKAFLQIGPTSVDAMIQGYASAPWEGKVKIAEIAERFGPKAAKIVLTLAAGLRDSDTDVRKASLRAIGKMGAAAQPALPRLTKFLSTPRVSRQNWLGCLRVMLDVGDQGVLALQQLLEGKNWELRKKIIEGLAQLGSKVGSRGVPVLVSALQHKEKEVRWVAAMTLRKLKHNAKPAVSALIQALKAADATTRKLSAKALGAIGSGAKEALPALRKRAGDANASVQTAAREAIALIQKGGAGAATPRKAPTPPRNQ